MVVLLIGGILAIIAAVGKVLVDVRAGNRETTKIHKLVDGQRGELLQKIADLERLLAGLSQRKDDRARADASQSIADSHKTAVSKTSEKE